MLDNFRSIINGSSQNEYKLNNVPMFPWEASQKPTHEDKSFRIVQKGELRYKSFEIEINS